MKIIEEHVKIYSQPFTLINYVTLVYITLIMI